MNKTRLLVSFAFAALLAATACVHQTEVPALSGPSGYALSLNVTATPDIVTMDGSSSIIAVEVRDAGGAAKPDVPIRLDFGGGATECGQLSPRSLITGRDGRANALFTTLHDACVVGAGGTVDVMATVIGSNFQASVSRTARIRLVLPGNIVASGAPTATFTVEPTTVHPLDQVTFDASSSTPGQSHTITSYDWDFGDGVKKSGKVVNHDFFPTGTYIIALTVGDEIQQQTTWLYALSVTGP
jgi:hypothetical protein